MYTDSTTGQFQGNYSTIGDQRICPPPTTLPPPPQYNNVIYNMLKGLEQTLGQRLSEIEYNLQGQNKRWEHVESQLENQNTRMSNIEQQLFQMSGMKQALSNTNSRVMTLSNEVSNLKTQVETYDQSINCYSEQYDEIISFNTESDSKVTDLLKRVDYLEKQQAKSEDKLIDIQWRSMRENLIFTSIDEPEGVTENVELTLRAFLRDGMKIERPIEFDRVHRLGRYDNDRKYPRPIIAKFERFKEKEYVRQTAPDALYGTKYGVREQYPQEIEEKRKLLYPEAKTARQDKDNKVRLVRDKLYVNGKEVKVETRKNDNSYKVKDPPGREREMKQKWQNNTVYGRTIYPSRYRNIQCNSNNKPSGLAWQNPPKRDVPVKNRFEILSGLGECSENRDQSLDRKSVKNKASSPVDRDITFKKQREDDVISIGSEGPNETSMETETDTKIPENTPVNDSIHIQENEQNRENDYQSERNPAYSENPITADSETLVNADSELSAQNEQRASPIPKAVNNSPARVQQETVNPNTTPKMNIMNMPSFSEKSNDLYYGPAVITPPHRSPPIAGLNTNTVESNTQNLSTNSSA